MRGGTSYSLTRKCVSCGFTETIQTQVWGDFDGWSESETQIKPEKCPCCIHAARLLESLQVDIHNP
jgi:hypothetical protein